MSISVRAKIMSGILECKSFFLIEIDIVIDDLMMDLLVEEWKNS